MVLLLATVPVHTVKMHHSLDHPVSKVVLDLFRKGGEAILNGIARQDFDVLRGRPVVSKARKLGLLMEALGGKLRAGIAS